MFASVSWRLYPTETKLCPSDHFWNAKSGGRSPGLYTCPDEIVSSSGSSCVLALLPGAAAPAPVNPFQVNQPQPLTLNQLRGSPVLGSSASFGSGPGVETVAPMTSVAPHSSVGASGSSLTPLGPTAMNMVGSVGIPPSAAQSTGTTNPFLL
jgi:hypothetical protein